MKIDAKEGDIWKYILSNMNLIFEYSVLDKIRLDCKVVSRGLRGSAKC